ncbi:MAG: polysaccharide deacetylase family protein [Synechococcales bacterium]|nr:polysaccharide deacetylase family protein [Synechococcales bacterium]
MRARALKQSLRQAGQQLKQRIQQTSPIGAILMYHRVADLDVDPWGLAVTPDHFEEHLQVLRRYNCVLPLDQLAGQNCDRSLAWGSVAITFDDGYVDNLLYAKPRLEQYNLPATVYVSSACINQTREVWWDELEKIILLPDRLPERLHLNIRGRKYDWQLERAAFYTDFERQRDRRIPVWQADPQTRLGFYYTLWQLLQPLFPEEQSWVLDALLNWVGLECSIRDSHRTLSLEELRQLDQGDLITIGAHTVHHPHLPSHHKSVQLKEILQGKYQLQGMLGHSITSFSYPFGGYTRETIQLIEQAEFENACSTIEDPVWWGSGNFTLPRFTVYNWDGKTFEQHLNQWLANNLVAFPNSPAPQPSPAPTVAS